jgi:transposase
MSSKRRRYTEAFKRELVALYEAGERSAASLEREYGLGSGNLWRWINRYGFSEGGKTVGIGSRTAEERQIRELERELAITRQERDILKKAVAIFSRPKQSGSSSSRPTELSSR